MYDSSIFVYNMSHKSPTVFLVILLVLLTVCCNEKEMSMKYDTYKLQYKDVWGLKIPFPEKLSLLKECNCERSNKNKLLVFISTNCSECVSKMEIWKNLLGEKRIKETDCLFIALGKPTEYFKDYIESQKFPFTIYIDTTGNYMYRNNISNYYTTSLLLNKVQQVVMVGSPENDTNIYELFQYAATKN